MFTHQIVDKKFEAGVLSVAVTFTDGVTTFTEWFSTKDGQDISWLKRAINRRIQDAESLSKQEFAGEIDLTEEAAASAPKPENQWATGLSKLRQMQELISLGVIDNEDEDYVALLKKMKKNYSADKLA